MKLTEALQSILHKKKPNNDVYLSLFLDAHYVAASFWQPEPARGIRVLAGEGRQITEDSWEARAAAVDELVGMLEEKTGQSDITTTILGLPSSFLTPVGEIRRDVRTHIKKLASDLELTLAGFVPLNQAIIYKFKTEEGVPPSIILLGINSTTIAVSLYKIGVLVGVRDIEKHADVAAELEGALKSFSEMEVLPARVLLYGADQKELEEIKTKLLAHPWTTRANFLHFPKVELVVPQVIIDAISLAGASEMKSSAPPMDSTEKAHEEEESSGTGEVTAEASVPQAETEEKDNPGEEETLSAVADGAPPQQELEEDTDLEDEVVEEQAAQEMSDSGDMTQDDNVVMVDAQTLGFKKDVDVLEKPDTISSDDNKGTGPMKAAFFPKMRHVLRSLTGAVRGGVKNMRLPQKAPMAAALGILVIVLIVIGMYWVLPRAVVTVYVLPQTVTASESIILDADGNSTGEVIAAVKREKTVSGDKTVPVLGTKNVGDPARGSVTIYNKSLSSRLFKKGTILTAKSLKFVLDEDVQVASASESIGSITFGKTEGRVTASAIGTQSNLPAGTEFAVGDVGSGTAIARNDAALTGGTSREVTIVTRADVDAFVAGMSAELTQKAKEELSSSVEGGETLVAETITTTVTEKVFDQEIDEESDQLHGKITVAVSGIAYSDSSIESFFLDNNRLDLPDGYTLDESNTKVTLTDVEVKKDGTITADARVQALALPHIDQQSLLSGIAGKNPQEAQRYLQTIPGTGGLGMSVRFNVFKNRLPVNKNNISISISAL